MVCSCCSILCKDRLAERMARSGLFAELQLMMGKFLKKGKVTNVISLSHIVMFCIFFGHRVWRDIEFGHRKMCAIKTQANIGKNQIKITSKRFFYKEFSLLI